jgi:hypothetical protein
MKWLLCLLLAAEPAPQLGEVHRVFVDRLTGGETAAQMRDLLISSLHNTKLFVLTENAERADAILRGSAEDLIYTDEFSASDGVDVRASASSGTSRSTRTTTGGRGLSVSVGDDEKLSVRERKHEAMAAVRLVNREGDVIWSTTQESSGAKFRGASADVAEKVTRQLVEDYGRVKRAAAGSIP